VLFCLLLECVLLTSFVAAAVQAGKCELGTVTTRAASSQEAFYQDSREMHPSSGDQVGSCTRTHSHHTHTHTHIHSLTHSWSTKSSNGPCAAVQWNSTAAVLTSLAAFLLFFYDPLTDALFPASIISDSVLGPGWCEGLASFCR
jgi:hypothetical protein